MKKLILLSILTFLIFQTSFPQEYGWTDISANIPTEANLSDVFFVSDNEGWITSSSHAEIYHTTDGGLTFEIQTTLLSTNAIHMLNENVGYTGGESGFVYRTTDGGGNWNFHGTTVSTLADISFPPSGNTGYCCGFNGSIWSIDSSVVTKMTSNVNGHLVSLCFPINNEEGWVCGGSVIRHYKNSVWNGDQDMPSGGYNAIYMVDTLYGWVVGDGGIIAYTIDGQNWFEQTNPDPNQNTFFDLFFLDENNGWAIGGVGTIIHTTNGGVNWNVAGAGLSSNSLTGVHFTSPTNGYVVGNGKTLLKYTQLSGMGNTIVETLQFNIFTNPATSVISIQSAVFGQEAATIEIVDLNGRKLIEKDIPIGRDKYEIDVSQLKNGIHFCTLRTQDNASTQKLIIQK